MERGPEESDEDAPRGFDEMNKYAAEAEANGKIAFVKEHACQLVDLTANLSLPLSRTYPGAPVDGASPCKI